MLCCFYDCISVSTILPVAAILAAVYYWYKRPSNMPPGPRGIPFLGVVPFVEKQSERTFFKWKKDYGSVLSVRMGREDWVVLNDYESIYQALVKQGSSFSGRPSVSILDEITNGHGLAFLDYCEKWKSQRKFGLMTLRGFGVGKKGMEERILEEVDFLCNKIRAKNGKPFDIQIILMNAVANVIWNVVIGHRCEYEDGDFKRLIDILRKWFSSDGSVYIEMLMYVPHLKYVPPFYTKHKELKDDISEMLVIFKRIIEDHENTYDENNSRDFIDAFILEMKRSQSSSDFTHLQLMQYLRDLFEAGSETTTSTTRWALLCMLHYPETQDKLREEIMNVIGSSARPSMSHKTDMPYMCAFIQEVFRFRTLVPLNVPHKTTEKVNIKGYTIPKGTAVFTNLWAVHNDPDVWDEPNKFKPERHLDDKGNFVHSNHVIPFSVGPRHCLGEQLARMEVFIFLVSLVQKFEFLPDPDAKDLPDIENGSHGTVFVPLPYKLLAKEI
uniref:Cytochrome P450 2U1 n=1 Tax=Ciona savignyi TaxID=51511 RepID=H2YB90_CIOSA